MQILLQAGSWLQHGSVSNHIAGLVLFSSGIFQFLPMKRACLSHCRNPLTYFMSHWKNGPAGGLRLGLIHGTYCLGCCWLLMMTGFAMGVMNMAGMALLTIIIAVEQVVPYGDRVGYVFGVVLAAWGCLRLLL
jgi:predicted metal-binding membrane protein